MPDKKKMPADGGGIHKGEPDGVSGTPGKGISGQVHGRFDGGESAGGAYPNPDDGKSPKDSGFLGTGGQSEIAYYGGDNPNATTRGGILDGRGNSSDAAAPPVGTARKVRAGERTLDVVEENGAAAAEASGRAGAEPPHSDGLDQSGYQAARDSDFRCHLDL